MDHERLAMAVRVASQRQSQSDWLPIETAPKDGTEVMIAVPTSSGWVQYTAFYMRTGAWAVWSDLAGAKTVNPSKWMPLPSPPKPSNSQSGS